MTILNVILFICTYPTVFILYYFQKSTVESYARRGVLFGISCAEWMPAQERGQVLETYLRQSKRYLRVFALLPAAIFFVPYVSVSITMWMLWILAVSIVQYLVPFAQGFNQVQKMKAVYALPEEARDGTLYELKDAGSVRTLRPQDLILPAALNLGLVPLALYELHDTAFQSYSPLFPVMALCGVLLLLCGLWTDRTKTQVINRDSDVNINFTRANKRLWKVFWLANCWFSTVYSYFLLIYFALSPASGQDSLGVLAGAGITLSLLLLAFLLWFLRKKVKLDRLYADRRDFSPSQENRGWVGGIIYYNPQDRHILVPQKMGGGSTFNLATPAGKGFTVFGALCLLLGFGVCVWLMLDEFTPIKLSLQGETLEAEHTGTEFEVPLGDIVSLTLLDELPRMRKANGSGLPNLNSGTFRTGAEGKVKVLLNPKLERFLRVETEDTVYYFSSDSDETTREIYESLMRALP